LENHGVQKRYIDENRKYAEIEILKNGVAPVEI